MNDLFYYFGIIFIINGIKSLVFFNREFEKSYAVIEGSKSSMDFLKKALKERKEKDLCQLEEERSKIEEIIKDNMKTLDNKIKPNKLSNVISVLYFLWHIVGVIASNLWVLFSLNLIITGISAFLPLFYNTTKKQEKIISVCNTLSKIVVMGEIIYLHFN